MHETQILTQQNKSNAVLDPGNANTCKQPVPGLLKALSTYVQMQKPPVLWTSTYASLKYTEVSVCSLQSYLKWQQRQNYTSKLKAASLVIWLGGFFFSPLGQIASCTLFKSLNECVQGTLKILIWLANYSLNIPTGFLLSPNMIGTHFFFF